MIKKLLGLFLTILLVAVVTSAQDGKLRGIITDKTNGEPLIGATVSLEGTMMGAASDINGEFFVLSVPPGTYSIKASYVGYASVTISNVRILSNVTTTQNFQLLSEAVQVDAVEIIAERPLIQRNTTNTVRVTTQEDIRNLPIRGLENILSLQAGVVDQDNQLYVRGGRSGEIAYFVDGASTTNPITNSQTFSVIQEAVEELQLQAGGYTAEFGGANSGIARTTLRTGQSNYKGSFDFLTDNLAKPGGDYLGSSSFGFTNLVATLSGPVMKNLKFFIAGQHQFIRNRSYRFIEPFRFENIVTDINDPVPGRSLPGPIEFKKNYVPGNWLQNYSTQGNLNYEFESMKFKLSGSYTYDKSPFDNRWPTALTRYFNKRSRIDHNTAGFANFRFTHVVNPKTFYEVALSYQDRYFRRVDPDFGDEWKSYTDSTKNAELGYTGWRRPYAGPLPYSIINAFILTHENAPNNAYSKNRQTSYGFSGDITSQLTSNWEIKLGTRFDSWIARNYSVGNIQSAMEFLYGTDGRTPKTFADDYERRVRLSKAGTINHYGYDVDGNEVSSGIDGPRKPLFASAYVQNKLEYQDIILNLGLRYEYFDTKNKTFKDPLQPDFNTDLDVIDENKLEEAKPFNLVLPRISFSFPVTDVTVFYAMYGKYAQMPSLNQLYVGNTTLSRTVSPITRGNAFLTPVGYLMIPERTTQYEMGIRQTLADNFAFTVSGFYKDIKDQLQVRSYVNEAGSKLFTAYLNDDFGTIKGLELTLELRRTNRLASKFNYTLSDARGTGSNSRSAFGAVEQNIGIPTSFINPLDFNQTHSGSLLLDYRFAKGDGGPILEQMGVNLILSFNSGHAYTKIKELKELGQADVWNVGVEPLNDPRASFPTEPLNSSTTPWVYNIDLNFSKKLNLGLLDAEFYVNIINLLNTKDILNVYPTTGTAQDDGWLGSPLAAPFHQMENYTDFYKAINSQNRWAYMVATGNDLFGTPRQVRFGLRLEI